MSSGVCRHNCQFCLRSPERGFVRFGPLGGLMGVRCPGDTCISDVWRAGCRNGEAFGYRAEGQGCTRRNIEGTQRQVAMLHAQTVSHGRSSAQSISSAESYSSCHCVQFSILPL
eukprot:6483187-Amphidinium_carterae.1